MNTTAPLTLDDLADRLDGVRWKAGRQGFTACCPAHEDRAPSLSVDDRDGTLLVYCHAGCDYQAIMAALNLAPVRPWSPPSAPARPKPAPTPKAEPPARVRDLGAVWYDIRDPAGVIRAAKRRENWLLADGTTDKECTWWRSDHRTAGLNGTALVDLPLYGSERLAALPDGATVVVTEGEKAAAALVAAGIPAVGTVTGAASTPSATALAPLARLDVVLWPDNDQGGRDHMGRIAGRLAEAGATVRWFDWRRAPLKGDAADWLAEPGADPDALIAVLDNAPPWLPAPSPDAEPVADCPRQLGEALALIRSIDRLIYTPDLAAGPKVVALADVLTLWRQPAEAAPVYRTHKAVAAGVGVSRDVVASARTMFAERGALALTVGPPPADLVAAGRVADYDGAHIAAPAPVTEAERRLPPAARLAQRIACTAPPRPPHGNTGQRRQPVALPDPLTFEPCPDCPPTTPVELTIACTGCGQVRHQTRAVPSPPSTTVQETSALTTYKREPADADPAAVSETVQEKSTRFVTAEPADAVAQRRRAIRTLQPEVAAPAPRPRCAASLPPSPGHPDGWECDDLAADGSAYCPTCRPDWERLSASGDD